jgi:hypothetical protein
MLDEFSLPQEAIPTLALLTSSEAVMVYTFPVPKGNSVNTAQTQTANPWQDVLAEVERDVVDVVDEGDGCIGLDSLPRVVKSQLVNGLLDKLVGKLLASLS